MAEKNIANDVTWANDQVNSTQESIASRQENLKDKYYRAGLLDTKMQQIW